MSLKLSLSGIKKFQRSIHETSMNQLNYKPSHFGSNVIDLLVFEVGSYIIRIRQVLGHFVLLENLKSFGEKLAKDRAASNMAATKLHFHNDERKINLYPGLMCQLKLWTTSDSFARHSFSKVITAVCSGIVEL